MLIGKKQRNHNICGQVKVDTWEDEVVTDENGKKRLIDKHIGKEHMKEVNHKKYLGQIIQSDGRNEINIKDKTDKAVGNVTKIITSLTERPYGKHTFKAALLMIQGLCEVVC